VVVDRWPAVDLAVRWRFGVARSDERCVFADDVVVVCFDRCADSW
jgi:hypothetical protein